MMRPQHMLYGLELTTIVLVACQPTVAQTVGINPLDTWSQLSIIGMLGALLWWQIAKSTPEIQRLHTIEINRSLEAYTKNSEKINNNIQTMTTEIKGLRDDSTKHQKEWVGKLEERPCIGLEGLKKLEASIKQSLET